jgi:hypothetical protein
MRINFTLPVLVMSMFIVCASCSKNAQQEMVLSPASQAVQEINAAVASDALYEMPVNSENVKIHKQASHFELSSIGTDSKSGMLKYKYSPAKGFTGTDEVTLSETRTYMSVDSEGGCNNSRSGESNMVTSTTFIKIRFTVQ